MRDVPSHFWSSLNALRDNEAYLWLFIIEVGSGNALHVVPNPLEIVWQSRTFKPWPIQLGTIEESGEGEVATTTLGVSNIGGLATTYLETDAFRRAVVWSILVDAASLSMTDAIVFRWQVRSANEQSGRITMNLALPDFWELPFPRKRFIRSHGFPNIPRRRR